MIQSYSLERVAVLRGWMPDREWVFWSRLFHRQGLSVAGQHRITDLSFMVFSGLPERVLQGAIFPIILASEALFNGSSGDGHFRDCGTWCRRR